MSRRISKKEPGRLHVLIFFTTLCLMAFGVFGCGSSSGGGGSNTSTASNPNQKPPTSLNRQQGPPAVNVRINYIDTTYCPIVKTYASVTDQDGNLVLGLTTNEITLIEDTVLQSSAQVMLETSVSFPISVAMVLDYSGSMSPTAINDMEAAAIDFVNQMKTEDWGEIIKFSEISNVVQPYTDNKEALKTAISNGWPYSGYTTMLYDAIYQAVTDTAGMAGRQSVIVITDGNDNVSSYTVDDVIELASSNRVPIFTIGIGQANTQVLEQIAGGTGGNYFYAPTSSDLTGIYLQVSEILQNQYVISYESILSDGASHDIQVSVEYQGLYDSDLLQLTACQGPPSISFLASIDTPGMSNEIDINGNYCYVADGPGGLQIIDISDPQHLTISATLDTTGGNPNGDAVDLFVSGEYLYMAANENGIVSINISDPLSPAIEKRVLPSDAPDLDLVLDKVTSVFVNGSYIYLLDSDSGMAVLRVDSQRLFWLVETIENVHGSDIAVFGGYAYVTDGIGLRIYDVSNPYNIQAKGSVVTSGQAKKLSVSYPNVYVADGTGGLSVVEVRDPNNPQLLGEIPLPGDSRAVHINGSYAYIANYDSRVDIVDVSSPTDLRLIDSEDTNGEAGGITVGDSYVYVADGADGLAVIHISY